MSQPVRWILLLVVVSVATGVTLWMVDGTDEPAGSGHVVAPRTVEGDGAGRATELLPPVDPSAAMTPATPRELLVEPAPATVGETAEAAAAAPRVTVIGRLVSRRGRPIEGAVVSLMDGPAPGMQALFLRGATGGDGRVNLGIGHDTTDREGAFRIEAPLPEASEQPDLPAMLGDVLSSRSRLLVEHADFVTGGHAVPTLIEGVVDAGTLVLQGAGRIVGRVLAAGGGASTGGTSGSATGPVKGARLAAQPAAGGAAGLGDLFGMISGDSEHQTATAATGEDGVFELGGLPAGFYDVAVHAEGHPQLQVEDVRVEVGRATALGDLALERGSVLGGVVRDGSGEPVSGLRVRARRDSVEGVEALAEFSMRIMLGDTQQTATTDEQGLFLFEGISEGRYDLTAGGGDTGWSQVSLDDVVSGTRDAELAVHRLGELLVRVQARSGGPELIAVALEAERVDDDESLAVMGGGALASSSAEPLPPDRTLADGAFLVRGAGRDGTDLVVSAEGYATARLRAPPVLGAQQLSLDVLLTPESRVEGVVLDDRGDPVVGAEVEARALDDTSGSSDTASTISGSSSSSVSQRVSATGEEGATMMELMGLGGGEPLEAIADENGRFRLTGLGAGDWEVRASAEGFIPSAPQVVVLGDSDVADGLELVLASGGTILGAVLEPGGLPVEDAHVHIKVATRGGFTLSEDGLRDKLQRNLAATFGVASEDQRTVRTDATGHYEASGLVPGDYSVTLKKKSTSPIDLDLGALLGAPPPDDGRTQWVTVRARESVHADFVRSPRASVTVRVTAGGAPVAGANVSLADSGSSVFGIDLSFGGNSERTDEDGLVHFEDLEPAGYKVTAAIPDAVHVEEARVELAAGRDEQLELAFGGVSLLGRVLDERGEPAPGVAVSLSREQPEEPEESGGFLSNLLGEGNFNVTMSVNDPSGGDHVTRRGTNLFGLTGKRITTDSDGAFEMKYLSPGAWQIGAGGGAWIAGEPLAVDIDAEGVPERITLHVRRGATVEGQVIEGSSEEPLDEVEVVLQRADGGTLQTTDSKQGAYRFEGVPEGDFVLLIEGDDGPRARREVHVTGGGTTITAHLVTLD